MIRTKPATRAVTLLVASSVSLGAACSSAAGDSEAFCDVVRELHAVEEMPSASLVSRYEELAPAEVETYVDHWAQQMRAWRDGGVAKMRLDDEYSQARERYDSFLREECGMDRPSKEERRQAAEERWANLEAELEVDRNS